jgi:hypothetical protein
MYSQKRSSERPYDKFRRRHLEPRDRHLRWRPGAMPTARYPLIIGPAWLPVRISLASVDIHCGFELAVVTATSILGLIAAPLVASPGFEVSAQSVARFGLAGGSVGAVCGVDAQAQHIDGEFLMLCRSLVVASWHGVGKAKSNMKADDSSRAQHEQLVATGAIGVEAGRGRVTLNTVFSSRRLPMPSLSAGPTIPVESGFHPNGRSASGKSWGVE